MKTIEELRAFLIKQLPDTKIYLFGSRARGDASEFSDIDIALYAKQPLGKSLSRLRFMIEESQIPYKVDLIDLSLAPYLKDIIKKEGILWH